jgi:mannose-6-phosphate isomerase-like protein (cupin superfamily)
MNNHFYDKNKIIKPWGEEHNVFRDKKKLCITLLKINPNCSTSLHCHPNKKTGFILLSGTALIQLGLFKSSRKKYNSPSRLMIRSGLFHSIKCISKRKLLALEFETPVDKNDLVRFQDKYGRKNTSYEGKKSSKSLSYKDLKFNKNFKTIQKYKFENTIVEIKNYVNLSSFKKYSNKDIFGVISGSLIDKFNKKIFSPGDIIRTGTLLKLSEAFKIKKNLVLVHVYVN